MNLGPHSLKKEFVVLSPQKRTSIELVDSSLYERLNKNYQGFKGHELISLFEFGEDWSSWEIHPNGDEIVMLLSGKAELVLELESGNQSVMLENVGEYAVVPINTWHMAKTSEPTQLVFVTPGEDTGHRNA